MVSDSITGASILAGPNAKNLGKKKRVNRSAKLKQCKFDARREQWLSQGWVNKNGFKDGGNDAHTSPALIGKDSNRSLGKVEVRHAREENEGSIHQESDLESPSNSFTSVNSSVLGSNDSGTSFTGSSSSSISSSVGCCSGNITEEEEAEVEEEGEGDDGCLDNWELMADALAADEKHKNQCSESPSAQEPSQQKVSSCEISNGSCHQVQESKLEGGRLGTVPPAANRRAWRADDTFRPQSLPNLSKQHNLPNPERYYAGGVPWAYKAMMPAPSPCPICFEDLDMTDSTFIPCLCGFRLCLFCHKRILEEDGRCPGCRKPYEQLSVETDASVLGGSLAFQLARSCSMIERS